AAPPAPALQPESRARDLPLPVASAAAPATPPSPTFGAPALPPAFAPLPIAPGPAASAPPAAERIANVAAVGELPDVPALAALRRAALAGEPVAVYEFAARLAEGRGATRDLALAAKLFEKAAAHGFVPAQYRIGNHYEKGLGVTRDLAIAIAWYQRAADRGNARAMHNLAVLLADGGGKPDYAAAVAWFRRAAELGVRDSQFNLAVLLARGLGVKQDLAQSYTWFAVAAAQGDADAGRKRDEVGARMSGTDLAAARTAAERWRATTPDPAANEVVPPANGWAGTQPKPAGDRV
ncbi:MAG TPA: tetratricopeptide repeat protein, partial [Beijerinckiaceae bacterium]|nr:tetratricopeptide repeat protein [Beijerinckiaceae bacterium]